MNTQKGFKNTGRALIAGALLVPTVVGLTQGLFDAKPLKLPWRIAFVRDKNLYLMKKKKRNCQNWKATKSHHS